MALYRNMNRAALDAAYNNTKAIPDFPATLARFQEQSMGLYQWANCKKNIAYGPHVRQCFDWFPAAQVGSPTFVFIHGGYWQNCTKEDFAFIAHGPLGCGFNVVLAEYTLAPQATMAQIVEEIGCLLDYLATDPQRLGSFGSPICLSGHSAGGHLTALHRGHAAVTYAMAISALTELEPISLCWLNDLLQLTPKEIAAYSPVRHIGAGVPMIVAVGAAELPELVRQSDEYAAACQWAGEDVTHIHVPGCTHFSILEDLAQPDGLLMKTLMQRLFTLNR